MSSNVMFPFMSCCGFRSVGGLILLPHVRREEFRRCLAPRKVRKEKGEDDRKRAGAGAGEGSGAGAGAGALPQ